VNYSTKPAFVSMESLNTTPAFTWLLRGKLKLPRLRNQHPVCMECKQIIGTRDSQRTWLVMDITFTSGSN
jgi:hypothetical protein